LRGGAAFVHVDAALSKDNYELPVPRTEGALQEHRKEDFDVARRLTNAQCLRLIRRALESEADRPDGVLDRGFGCGDYYECVQYLDELVKHVKSAKSNKKEVVGHGRGNS